MIANGWTWADTACAIAVALAFTVWIAALVSVIRGS